MRRYGWILGIGAVLLCVLAWIVVGKSLADDETKLGPPIVIPSATSTTAPQSEPTLEESRAPKSPSSPPPGSADGDATGAERIAPAPPRHAGDDERDDDRDDDDHDSDDADRDDADDDRDDDDRHDAYDEDDDHDDHDDAEDDDEDDDDD
ncbi:hypothetical protein [Brevibacterium renqingii]|uniref:hypothetical protein n=1 Tax=Brevibacterium renqingii TaxID=2776916 RepID=UPI001AE02B51|nr:hypothetical protein [Brevibacterium renqingii]